MKKLDKLADDIKNLPANRQERLKGLLEKRAYSTKDAAEQLGISLSTLRRLMRAGMIDFFRISQKIRIASEEIDRFGNSVSLKEAAKILDVHTLTISRLIKVGKLKSHRIGRAYRIPLEELNLFMQGGNAKPSKIHDLNEKDARP